MDDWYQDLKGKTHAKAREMFKQNTYNYALSLKNQQNDGETKIKPATLTNDDLPQIINGSNSDPIEKQPFSCYATKEKIFKVGWLWALFLSLGMHCPIKRCGTYLVMEVQVRE